MMEENTPLSNELRNLGKMRKKRGNDAFKNALRAKISEKAEEMQNQPAKASWDWKKIFGQRMIPAVSFVLVIGIMVQVLGPGGIGTLPIELVNVAEAQDYYTLTPSEEDGAGIDANAYFTLDSKGELDADEIAQVISITPETTFTIDQVDNDTVILIPDTSLDSGELVQIELAAQNLDDAPYKKTFRWAYSVSDSLRITGTHPGDQTTYAPINTGIEISMSHTGVSNLEKNFSIAPAVDGSFESDGKTLTFIPSENLRPSTVYTVSIGSDLAIEDSENTIGDSYEWQFETDDEADVRAYLTVDRFLTVAPNDASLMKAYAWSKDSDDEPLLDVQVYAYPDDESYLNAVQGYHLSAPAWTYQAKEEFTASNAGLTEVVSLDQITLVEQNYRDYIQLPTALEPGHYLMNVSYAGEEEQAFLQVSDTATYLAMSPKETVVWVNDLETGEPVKGAKVSVADSNLSAKTDADGIAIFNELYDELGIADEKESSVQFVVESDKDTTYYEESFYQNSSSTSEDVWSVFETDRSLYQPNDTVQYWGMIQGKDAPINGDAKLYVTSGFFYGWYGSSINDFDDIIEERDITIEDGKFFEGELDLVEFGQNQFAIYIVQDEEILLTDYFQVLNFELPAYEIVLSSDRDSYMAGETINVDIEARFFDGTPVGHTELRVNNPDDEEVTVTTNDEGQASVSWTSTTRLDNCDSNYSCGLSYGDSFYVSPVQEELVNIGEYFNFEVYRSSASLEEYELDHSAWDFSLYEVDVHNDYSTLSTFDFYSNSHISDVVASSGSVDYSIERQEIETVVTGEYYDEVDKVIRQETKTETNYYPEIEGTLTPDSNGHYSLDFEFDDTKSYQITAWVNDGKGGTYKESIWLNKTSGGGTTPYLTMEIMNEPDDGYSIGDYVEVEAGLTDGSFEADDENEFLFIQAQQGVVETTIQSDPLYRFKFEEEDVPNVYISTVRFNGEAYQTTHHESIRFRALDKEIELAVSTDKDEYTPGEEISIEVKADEATNLQIQLVDEAYYSLYDEDLYDPLSDLYATVGSGIDAVTVSHKLEELDGGKGGCFVAGTQILMADGSSKNIEEIQIGDEILTRENEFSDRLIVATVSGLHGEVVRETLLVNGNLGLTDNHIIFLNGKWTEAKKMKVGDILLTDSGDYEVINRIETVTENRKVFNFEVAGLHTYFADGIYVHNDKGGSARSDFPITAYFEVGETDANGNASFTFDLPDSITEWRVAVAAVTSGDEIKAGAASVPVIVTKDAFAVPVLNTTYLDGDEPMLPIRAYGSQLSVGQTVNFYLESESMDLDLSADGEAFETTYFDAGTLSEGEHDFRYAMESESGEDAILLSTDVLNSYFTMPFREETQLKDGVSIPGSDNSRTTVTFLNLENGPIYWELIHALYQDGERVDQAIGRSLAADWLTDVFDDDQGTIEFNAGNYQDNRGTADAGVSLFPYSDPDLGLSAQLAALAPDRFNEANLEDYFDSELYSPERTLTEKMQAIYGLAGLGKNRLLEMSIFEREFELSTEDKLWAALAYREMGSGKDVTRLYLELAQKEDWSGEELMLLAGLADYVADEAREDYYEAAVKSDDYTVLQGLLYVKQRLTHISGDPVSFSLNGENLEIEAGNSLSRSYSSDEIDSVEISNVKGDILAISTYQDAVDYTSLDVTDSLSLTRTYKVNGRAVEEINSGDIVEVHLTAKVTPNEGYRVTDLLPSGLKTMTRSYVSWWSNTGSYRSPYSNNGQESSFYIYCRDCSTVSFYYYARVINPGEFTAEPALLQHYQEPDNMQLSGAETVIIQP